MKGIQQKIEFEHTLTLYEEDEEKKKNDLKKIDFLLRGNIDLTQELAQEIYYRIKLSGVQFQTMTGLGFLEKITHCLTEDQMLEIRRRVAFEIQKQQKKERFWNWNKGAVVFLFAMIFLLSFCYLNWNLFLDMKTNYDAYMLQVRMNDDERTAAIIADWKERKEQELLAQKTDEEIVAMQLAQEETKQPEILGKFRTLYEENPDFSGWLKVEGTKVDYPVMVRENDNEYYLDKNFQQEQDKNGLLILDYRCDVLQEGQNLIIYGHNMSTGVMFGTLKKYKDREFAREHPSIYFDTLYEECEYRIVAAMLSEVAYADEDVFRYYDAIDISTQENFNIFRENIARNALYMTDETLSYGDSCLILSTCDRYKEDGRFVVIAKKIQK